MGKLVIHPEKISAETAEQLIALCPFNAISYHGSLEISSACKMCKMCVRKGNGAVTFEEEESREIDKSLWKGICVYADTSEDGIHPVTLELCGKAKELAQVTGQEVYALVLGSGVSGAAEELLHYGVDRVFLYDHPELADFRIEPYTAAFCDFIEKEKPSSILVGATALGRQLAPRVAARCKTGLTADCTVLEMKENTDLVQIRPAFGGNIMAQIITPRSRPQFCTVRYKIFSAPARSPEATGKIVPMSCDNDRFRSRIEVLSTTEKPKDVDIAEAEVIVAIGRGSLGEEALERAEELCRLLGGVLACTRPLVEGGVLDAKHQIGLSGRTVKPKLILCLGISGSVQFAAGMKSSDCIVAINKDPNAPIFDVAHYGIVGDVGEIVPRLIQKIKEAK